MMCSGRMPVVPSYPPTPYLPTYLPIHQVPAPDLVGSTTR